MRHHLVPSGSLCATQDDMHDDTKHLFQLTGTARLPPPPRLSTVNSRPCTAASAPSAQTHRSSMRHDARRLRAQMGDAYAYAFLLKHDWVLCAPNMLPPRAPLAPAGRAPAAHRARGADPSQPRAERIRVLSRLTLPRVPPPLSPHVPRDMGIPLPSRSLPGGDPRQGPTPASHVQTLHS